jgi:hypothetical protein
MEGSRALITERRDQFNGIIAGFEKEVMNMITKYLRLWIIVAVGLLISIPSFAQHRSSSGYRQSSRGLVGIHAGYLNPKDAKSGMLVGGTWGTSIDESVDIGIGFDIFHKSYREETEVATDTRDDFESNTFATELEYARTILPVMLEINVRVPLGRYMGYMFRGNLGYTWLHSKEKFYGSSEKQYKDAANETRNFGGFGWQLGAGIYYAIGSRSTLAGDVFYNSCEVSRDVKGTTAGLPLSERVDLSGMGVRLGVLLDLR